MGTTAQKLAYTASGVTDAYNAVNEKGGSIASNAPLVQLGSAIRAIPLGGGVVMSPAFAYVNGTESTTFPLTHSGDVEYTLRAVVHNKLIHNQVNIDGEEEVTFSPGQHVSTITALLGSPGVQSDSAVITSSPSTGSVCVIISLTKTP